MTVRRAALRNAQSEIVNVVLVDDEVDFTPPAGHTIEFLATNQSADIVRPVDQTDVDWRTQLQGFITDAQAALDANTPDLATNLATVVANANLATTVTKVNELVGRVNELATRSNQQGGRIRKNTRGLVRLARFIRDTVKDTAV